MLSFILWTSSSVPQFLYSRSMSILSIYINLIRPGHLSWCTRWRGTRRAWAGPLWAAPRGCCPAWGWTWSWGSRGCRGRAAAPSACCPAGAAPAADPARQSPEHGQLETRWDKKLSKLYLSDVWSYAFSGDSWLVVDKSPFFRWRKSFKDSLYKHKERYDAFLYVLNM